MDVNSRAVRPLSEHWVSEPPRWINPRQVVYASGDPLFGDPERQLWITDVVSGETREVTLAGGDDALKLSEAWSANGQQVVYQAAGDSTQIVVAGLGGDTLARMSDLAFARFGMSAAWSPDGSRLAIGGVGGDCPYGVLVFDARITQVARGNPPPSMCEPAFSPAGDWLAFTGVNPRVDGRVDVYVSNNNGFGATNLTGSLRGQIQLLGWVGGQ
jgi:Tol biopolymer transport system component